MKKKIYGQRCLKALCQKKHATSGKKVLKRIKGLNPDHTVMAEQRFSDHKSSCAEPDQRLTKPHVPLPSMMTSRILREIKMMRHAVNAL